MPAIEAIDKMENTTRGTLCCPQCRQENLHQWKYCSQCGAALWEPCLQCGELCAAGESYCGACGACIDAVAAELCERMDAEIRAAAKLEAECRLEEAIVLLARVGKQTHPRLAARAAKAREDVSRLGEQRKRLRIEAAELCSSARRRFEVYDYVGASKLLERLPPALMNTEAENLRVEVELKLQELQLAEEQLRGAARRKQLLELPPLLERVLELKPDHALARSLAGQLQDRLLAAARKLSDEGRHEQAFELLRGMKTWADAADFQPLFRRVEELAFLSRDLRNSPLIDAGLISVAERLRRLVPGEKRTIGLCDELQRRVRAAEQNNRPLPLPWANPPDKTPLGVPVEWLSGFNRFICAEGAESEAFRRQPTRFVVACGLALAGLNQAAMQINLLASLRDNVFSRLKGLARPNAPRTAWGIDLGASSLKAVRLAWDAGRKQAVVEAAVLLEHSKPLDHAANDAEEADLAAEALKNLLAAHGVKSERICVGLAGRLTLSRRLALPSADASRLDKMLRFEIAHQFPYPLEQLAWDKHVLGTSEAAAETPPSADNARRLLLLAAKRVAVERILAPFERMKIRVDVLQPDFAALHNLLVFDRLSAPLDSTAIEKDAATAVLDIGEDATNFVVNSTGRLWHCGIGLSGGHFTRALAKQFNLSYAKAEQLKRRPEALERMCELNNAVAPIFDELLRETERLMAVYAKTFPESPIRRLLILGGGSLMHGFLRYFQRGQ
jgi:type IV pilus assembly protein PilM